MNELMAKFIGIDVNADTVTFAFRWIAFWPFFIVQGYVNYKFMKTKFGSK